MAADDESSGVLLKQTLMSHGECFVYKVPPLATASGYRANDWNLAAPVETCGFQVERRNNDLYLLFTLENHTKLFALSKIEGEGSSINNINVETVMDSSRYFVCKIRQSNPGGNPTKVRTALLGFGFREREIAIDLLGNLQQFRQSIDRELEAKELASKTKAIPLLAEGEKLRIRIPGKGGDKKSTTVKSGSGAAGGSPKPILLKKPPPGADEVSLDGPGSPSLGSPVPFSPYKQDGKRFSMSAMECPLRSMTLSIDSNHKPIREDADNESDDESDAALAHSIVDDLLSVDDDEEIAIKDVGDASADDNDGGDEASDGAIGGDTVNDGSNGSLNFGDLNLDEVDELIGASPDTHPGEKNEGNDDDFGDFQGA